MAAAPHAGRAAVPEVLVVRGLRAGYDGQDVVRDLDLLLPPGAATRLAGRNGTGKSTVLRCLAGAQVPRAGQVLVAGADLREQPVEAKRQLGWSTGSCPFPYLTGAEHLALARRVHGPAAAATDELADAFPSWACLRALDRQVRTWSRGMVQQLSLLLAVAHRPRLLLLDEPSDGLDDEALADWTAWLHRHVATGGALLFVEHREHVTDGLPPHTTVHLTPSQLQEGLS